MNFFLLVSDRFSIYIYFFHSLLCENKANLIAKCIYRENVFAKKNRKRKIESNPFFSQPKANLLIMNRTRDTIKWTSKESEQQQRRKTERELKREREREI